MKRAVAVLLSLAVLSAAGAKEPAVKSGVQSSRIGDTPASPRTIVAYFEPNSALDPRFDASLASSLERCAVSLTFTREEDKDQAAREKTADSLLAITKLGERNEAYELNNHGFRTDYKLTFFSVELVLTDGASGKTVWRAQGEFPILKSFPLMANGPIAEFELDSKSPISGDLATVMAATRTIDPTHHWSNDVADAMLRDGLVAHCDLDRTVVAPPKEETKTVSLAAQTYEVLRAEADKKLDDITPYQDPALGSLLLVGPTDKTLLAEMPAPWHMAPHPDLDAYFGRQHRVAFEVNAAALSRAGLFTEVSILRADDVAERDFRGYGWKLFRTGGKGTPPQWVLARSNGSRQPVPVSPGVVPLNEFVARVRDAALAMPVVGSPANP